MSKIFNSQLSVLEIMQILIEPEYEFRHQTSTADHFPFITHRWKKWLKLYGEIQIIAFDISNVWI